MELIICAVRDLKAECFSNPFYQTTTGAAIRSFQDEVNRNHPENVVFNHPEDFQLFVLGKFDNVSGEFKSEIPKLLMSAKELKTIIDRKISKSIGGENVS